MRIDVTCALGAARFATAGRDGAPGAVAPPEAPAAPAGAHSAQHRAQRTPATKTLHDLEAVLLTRDAPFAPAARARRRRQRLAGMSGKPIRATEVACARPRPRRSLPVARGGSAPAKAGGGGRRGEGACGKARLGQGQVEAGRGDVVGRVGVKERGQVLDLAASHAELELAAPV